MRLVRFATTILTLLYLSLLCHLPPASADSSKCVLGVCLGNEVKSASEAVALFSTQSELDNYFVSHGCDLTQDGSCDNKDANYYQTLQARLIAGTSERAAIVPALAPAPATAVPTLVPQYSTPTRARHDVSMDTWNSDSQDLSSAASESCPSIAGATGSGSGQVQYLLYSWDCDVDGDRTCDQDDARRTSRRASLFHRLPLAAYAMRDKSGAELASPPSSELSTDSPDGSQDRETEDAAAKFGDPNFDSKNEGARDVTERKEKEKEKEQEQVPNSKKDDKELVEKQKEFEELTSSFQKGLENLIKTQPGMKEYFENKMKNVQDAIEAPSNSPFVTGKNGESLKGFDPQITAQQIAHAQESINNYHQALSEAVGANRLTPSEAANLDTQFKSMVESKTSAGMALNKLDAQLADIRSASNALAEGVSNPEYVDAWKNLNTSLYKNQFANILHADDVSTIVQHGGTCWTCHAIQKGYFEGAGEMIKMQNEIALNGKFTGHNGQTVNASELKIIGDNPSGHLDWSPWSGQAGVADQINNGVIGKLSGNANPWDGGFPENAHQGLEAVTGIKADPNSLGIGRDTNAQLGFIEGKYGPIAETRGSGHSWSYSSYYNLTKNADGTLEPVRYVMMDNSWGPENEKWVTATADNAGKLFFPDGSGGYGPGGGGGGGGGGVFPGIGGSGPGGVGGTPGGLRNNGNQGQPPLLSQEPQQINQRYAKLQQEYRCLTNGQKSMLRRECSRIVTQTGGPAPTVCQYSGVTVRNASMRAF